VKGAPAFPLQVVVAFVAVSGAGAYPLWTWAVADVTVAVAIGGILGLGNVLAGYWTIEYAFEKSYTTFLKAVLGGMLARMLGLLAAVLMAIVLFHVQAVALVVSLLLYSAVFLFLEIIYLQRKMLAKGRQ